MINRLPLRMPGGRVRYLRARHMASDACGRLLSLLSHELRAPLGVMRGYLRLLDEPPRTLSDQQRAAVSAALRATDHAAHLLTQASQLAQLHRGETPITPKRVEVKALLESALSSPPSSDAPITHNLADVSGQSLSANADQLSAALRSLVAAIARSQTTPGPIAIDASRQPRGNADGVLITMRSLDMPAESVEKALNTARGGLGLDLPIAEAVVAWHGGQVSEISDGIRCVGMVVWLPLAS